MNALKALWHDILLVWTFFTRIPAPHFMTERTLSQALWALPLVGLVIGLMQFFVLIVGGWTWLSVPTTVVLLVLIPVLITGALHLDGLGDVFDGLGVNKSKRGSVMRDSNLGAFGVLALVFVILFEISVYYQIISSSAYNYRIGLSTDSLATQINQMKPFNRLPKWSIADLWLIFVLVALISRAAMGLAWWFLPAMDSQTQASHLGRPQWFPQALVLVVAFTFALIFGILNVYTILLFVLFFVAWGVFIIRQFGGISGDILGAIQIIAEAAILLAILLSK